MAEKSEECTMVPERLERSESDAQQLELQQRAQACPRDSEKSDSDRPASSKNTSGLPFEHENGVSMPALSPSNLKKNVGVIVSPSEELQEDHRAVVVATSMSSTDTQASGHGLRVPGVEDVNSADSTVPPAAGGACASAGAAFRNLDRVQSRRAPPGFNINNTIHAETESKHMGGAALHGIPAGVADVVKMRNFNVARSHQRRVHPMERELGVQVLDEDGAVDLGRARRARRWINSCCACHEVFPEVTLKPCGHDILCQRCFMDTYFERFIRCPLCNQPVEGVAFSPRMLNILLRCSTK